MKNLKSKKGFYIVSPFLGFFFFLITVSIASFFITENSQQIDTAHAGDTHDLIFISYAIQADAFDVYLQNFLQSLLNTHNVYQDSAARTKVRDQIKATLSDEMKKTYEGVYLAAFGLDCTAVDRAWSGVFVKFNGQSGVNVLSVDKEFVSNGFISETAIWPHISRYGLTCKTEDPPIKVISDFTSRWYYLDATCICCQAPQACGLSDTYTFSPALTGDCQSPCM